MENTTISGTGLIGTVVTIPENGEHVHYCALSPDEKHLAAAFGNGVIRILNASTLETLARLGPGAPYSDLPATCVQWLPSAPGGAQEAVSSNAGAAYSLVSVSSAGGVFGWHFDESSTLERYASADEAGNEIAALDVSPDGGHFLTAGSDRTIRIYDVARFTCVTRLSQGIDPDGNLRIAHNNRIFSARYISATLIASAGWENPVQLWDTRTGKSFMQVHGTQPSLNCVEPFRKNTSLFLVSSESTTNNSHCVIVARGADGQILTDETEKICAALEGSVRRVFVSRADSLNGLVWCLSLSPPAVSVVSIYASKRIAALPLPVTPMNMCLSQNQSSSSAAYVCCQGGKVVRIARE